MGIFDRRANPDWTLWLRGLALAAAAVVWCWPFTVASGILAAALGALVGTLAAELAGRLRLRLGAALLLALTTQLLLLLAAHVLLKSSWPAHLLGPVATLGWSEFWRFLGLTLPVVFLLRCLVREWPALAALELLAVGLALASSLAAHRNGMVHRPFVLGDWAWSRGLDPALIFLAIGGLATVLLAALLLAEDRRRWPLHFAALLVLALVLLLIVRVQGLPQPQTAGDLGLTGDPAEGDPQDGEGGQGRGRGDRNSRTDGQLGDLEFKDEYSATGGEAPVAVVVLHDDYSPPSGIYYFRQSVFSQYNGNRLVQAMRDDVDRDVVARFPTHPITVAGAPPLAGERQALRATAGLLTDHVKPFALDSPALFEPVQNPNPLRFQRAFAALSHVLTLPYDALLDHQPGDPRWTPEQWQHYTEAPSNPRYLELATRLLSVLQPQFQRDPLAQALAIKMYLDEQGIYSRKSQHAGSADPTASFLFGDLTGYCVHFAHAATYLLRSLGLPARVAAGYAVPESARGSGSAIMIRGDNAHAWPELYLAGIGWVVVDPTPARSLDPATAPPDQALQRMLGEMLRQPADPRKMAEALARQWTLAKVLRGLLGLLLLLATLGLLVKVYRAWAPSFAAADQLYRVGYRAALDRLAEVGWSRQPGESREHFARRLVALAPTFVELTEKHLRAALGERQPADPKTFCRLADQVERELGQNVPTWRRLCGFCHPFSWMMAR